MKNKNFTMKNILKKLAYSTVVLLAIFAFYSESKAAPTAQYFRDLFPETDSTYDLGSTGERWAEIFGDNAGITNLTIDGLTGSTQCLTVDTNGLVSGTGAACGGAGSSPGGADTNIQFNDGGSFQGDAQLTWDKTLNLLSITGDISVSGFIRATTSLDYWFKNTTGIDTDDLSEGITNLYWTDLRFDTRLIATTTWSGDLLVDGNATTTYFSADGGNAGQWNLAFDHISEDGISHTFIDQDVTSGSSPTFDGSNFTNIPAASILAGTFGTGSYTFDTNLTVGGFASSTTALNTQGTLHVGGASSFDGLLSGTGWDNSWASKYNATTTLNGLTISDYLAIADFTSTANTWANASTTIGNKSYTDLEGSPSDRITAGTNLSWSIDTLNLDDNITLAGFASSTTGLFTQGNLHVGGTSSFDGLISGTGFDNAWNSALNSTTTWASFDTNFNSLYNATTTLNGFTPSDYLATTDFTSTFNTTANASSTIGNKSYTNLEGSPSDRITAGTNLSWSGDTLNATGGGSGYLPWTTNASAQLTATSTDVLFAGSASSTTALNTQGDLHVGGNSTFDGSLIAVGTNITGIPAANILAGTFGTGDYVMDGDLSVNGGSFVISDADIRYVDTVPRFIIDETGVAADEGKWNLVNINNTAFSMRTLSDDELSATTFLSVARTGTTIDTLGLTGTTISLTGNVGIGTASPLSILHTKTTSSTNPVILEVQGTGGSEEVVLDLQGSTVGGTSVSINFGLDATGSLTTPATNNFRPLARIKATQISSSAMDLSFQTKPDENQAFITRLHIEKDGNVGIGTTTPLWNLQVGDLGQGTYFSVDSSGNATSSVGFVTGDDSGTGTTTISIQTDGTSGSCFEYTNVGGGIGHFYFNSDTMVINSGACE